MRKLLSTVLLTTVSLPVLASSALPPDWQNLSKTPGWESAKNSYEDGSNLAPESGTLNVKQPTLNPGAVDPTGQYIVAEGTETIQFMFHKGSGDLNTCLSVGLYDNDTSTVLDLHGSTGWQVIFDNTKTMQETGEWITFEQTFKAGDALVFRLYDKTHGYQYFNGAISGAVGAANQYSSDSLNHAVIASNVATGTDGTYDYAYSLVGFEDRHCCPDNDFDDVIFTIRTGTAVTAVPEPETYAMLLAGLGVIGAVARRRRNK